MKKKTKVIITVSIIFVLVVATVVAIVLFSEQEKRKETTLASGLPSWTIESESQIRSHVSSASSYSVDESEPSVEEQFATTWNIAAENAGIKGYDITSYETIQPRFLLVRFNNGVTAAIDFTLDNEMLINVVGAESKTQLGYVAQICFASVTHEFENDTLKILTEQQDDVVVTLSGYEFICNTSKEKGGLFSASMKLIKTE